MKWRYSLPAGVSAEGLRVRILCFYIAASNVATFFGRLHVFSKLVGVFTCCLWQICIHRTLKGLLKKPTGTLK